MKPRFNQVLHLAVEEGVARGWAIAHKHDESPAPDRVRDVIYEAVISSLHEWFDMQEGVE